MSERNVKKSPAVRDIRYTPPPRKSFYARHKVKLLIAMVVLLAVIYLAARAQLSVRDPGVQAYIAEQQALSTSLAR